MTDDKSGFIDDEMESVASAVSKITFGDESAMTKRSATSFRTTNTGYKSILYKHQKGERRDRNDSKEKKKNVYGSKDVRVPYIVDVWSSRKSRMSCSMQVLCLTGSDPKKTHFFGFQQIGNGLLFELKCPKAPSIHRKPSTKCSRLYHHVKGRCLDIT